jgi:hypothetical protein
MRCAQCGEEGAVVTLNLERPPESVVARGIPGSVFREPAHFGNLTTR